MAQIFSKLRKAVTDRIWYTEKGAFAFLVDAPLTFGHSQLVVAIKPDKEDESFSAIAPHIAACIKKLRTSLPSPGDIKWMPLAKYTRSCGTYQKTLLLRTSADEKKNIFKIHLVPYFKSHFDATNKLYRVTYNKGRKDKGGLLHWLGQREVIVDYDMRDGRESKLVKMRIKSFHLEQLALRLHRNR
jgi:hypothetical protein